MKSAKFPFTYYGKSYILWAWKGDYINLGAGAELGIYYGGPSHWRVNKNLAMGMTLILSYKGSTIISYTEKTWWITGFNPQYQGVNASDLTACFIVCFNHLGMYSAFPRTKPKGWSFINMLAIYKF